MKRYGPGGEFWAEHAPAVAGVNYVPAIPRPLPIRTWQVWNEANFFYFAYPVSPTPLRAPAEADLRGDQGGRPDAPRSSSPASSATPTRAASGACPRPKFLEALYRVPGIKRYFDAVALHPYAFHVDDLEELTEDMREVVVENHDPRAAPLHHRDGLGLAERPQHRRLRAGHPGPGARTAQAPTRYLIANRHRLNLKGAYWFSWKDIPEY